MSEVREAFDHDEGGESEARFMTTMLLNSTEAVLSVLSQEKAKLNKKDAFALEILHDVLSKLDGDIALGETHKAAFKADEEDIEERVFVLAGSSDQDTESQADQSMPNYIDGQSRVKLEFSKGHELAELTVDIDLVRNLGDMPLPEGIPTNISFMIMGNFSDAFYKKIPTSVGLPNLHISYFIHYQGDQPMYHNNLSVDIAPPNMTPETVEERMRREKVYSYSPSLIEGILEGTDIVAKSRGMAMAGQIHDDSVIQNLGLVDIPNVGPSRLFLTDDNKSIKKVET
jgi:hypothetical protein